MTVTPAPTQPIGEPNSRPDGETPVDVPCRIALLGNPNTGKTTLFNRLCGLRARTANFPGITTEARIGRWSIPDHQRSHAVDLVDLPGVYHVDLDLPEACLCRDFLEGSSATGEAPDAIVVVTDANNLSRNLMLVGSMLRRSLPVVVVVNMIDLARRRGLSVDETQMSELLGCPVVATSARRGTGLDELAIAVSELIARRSAPNGVPVLPPPPAELSDESLEAWADEIVRRSAGGERALGDATDTLTERLDAAFTHPVLGVAAFAVLMAGLFATIFWLASFPMEWIEQIFEVVGGLVRGVVPPGAIQDLLTDGIIAGIAGTVVFLPQICLLFFLISLLEDTGYLARAAFVMDRIMCRFGLPGQAFVPLLSSHACAIPGIMGTKLIPDPQDRLATILVAPFMSCTARLPVYVLLISLLFTGKPLLAGLAFAGCYLLGAAAAMVSAFIARRTILKGKSRAMVLELPSYKWPSIRSAMLTTWDRGIVFLKNAGTIIMAICIVMWWLETYPHSAPPVESESLREQAAAMVETAPDDAAALIEQADLIEMKHAKAHSFAGRLGRTAQPIFAPLGYDWQLTVGVLTSFAAREVFVSTMAILIAGSEDGEDEGVLTQIKTATRDDGVTPLFTTASAASLLVFYVLAMQCLPTLAVTKRETGSWKWAILQLVYMSAVAYIFALVTYQGIQFLGAG